MDFDGSLEISLALEPVLVIHYVNIGGMGNDPIVEIGSSEDFASVLILPEEYSLTLLLESPRIYAMILISYGYTR